MTSYLLDTNHASSLMGGAEPITSRVRHAQAAGDHFGLSITVLGELYFAVYASQRVEWNRRRLQEMLDLYAVWSFDRGDAEMFGHIRAEQKAAGRPIPPLDAQIAAVARARGLVLLTADRHFQFVSGRATENWLRT